ncbi:MAG: translation elongation factor Ts, partial [Acidimicrobiales bacterium]
GSCRDPGTRCRRGGAAVSAPAISAADVQRLRQATGSGMLDAKRALERSGADFDAAARLLREEGKAGVLKRSDRQSPQGAVAMVVEPGVGVVVELRCETDFVAKSAELVGLVEELAGLVAADGIEAVAAAKDRVEGLAATLKENLSVGRVVRFDADSENVVDGYIHVQNDRGVNAVLVELSGGTRSLAHDVAVHIAFTRPAYLSREDVPESEVAAERETLEATARNEGKPEAALAKVVEGRLTGWFKDRVLLDQAFVRDEKQTIGQLLGGGRIVRFEQVVVGS